MDEQIIEEQKTENGAADKADDESDKNGSFDASGASEAELKILEEMMRAGLMYGHKKSKTNPKFRPYIYATRNGIEIIDLSETLKALEKTIEFLKSQIAAGATVLVVATQPAAKEAVDKLAEKFNFSRINEKWIGGLMTNFKVLSQRLNYYKKLKEDFDAGRLDKYTKKERVMINRDIGRMRKLFTGLENLEKLPDVLFVVDPSVKNHKTALREARRLKIKTIGIIDSDDSPDDVDYPIPANDHAKMSIDWMVDKIANRLQSTDYSKIEEKP